MNLNRIVLTGLFVLVFGGLGVLMYEAYFAEKGIKKVGYVDTAYLLSNYNLMKEANEKMESRSLEIKANLDTLSNEFQGMMSEYNRKLGSMSKEEKRLNEELLRTKQQQLGEYQNAVNQKIQIEQQNLTQDVLSKVNGFLEEYGKRNGYDIILGATQMGNIVYSKETYNITEDVLKELNEK